MIKSIHRAGVPAPSCNPPRWIIVTLSSLVVACGFGLSAGCGNQDQAKAGAGKAAASASAKPIVQVVPAKSITVPIVANPNGTTVALNEVSLRARVRGFLEQINFQEGQDVAQDQILFVIEKDPFEATLAAARAKQAEAEAALARARGSQARELAQAQVGIDDAARKLADVEEKRQKALVERKAVSISEYDRAAAALEREIAKVQYDSASLKQAQIDFEVNIASAEASLAAAKAEVRNAEIDLAYCTMKAPIAGRIGEVKVKRGNLVGPSAGGEFQELATIVQLDPIGIDLEVPSRYLERATVLLSQGLKVQLIRPNVEGLSAHPHEGQAVFINNKINPTTSTFLIRASVPNPDNSLLPGEYVKVRLICGELPDAVVVPEQAIMETQGGQIVYAVRQGKAVRIPVKGRYSYQGMRVIENEPAAKEHLTPGDLIVIAGVQQVRPGAPVEVKQVDWPPPPPEFEETPSQIIGLPPRAAAPAPEPPAPRPGSPPPEPPAAPSAAPADSTPSSPNPGG